jgi:hypothetical protein
MSWFWFSSLLRGNPSRQILQFILPDEIVLDHSNQELLDGTVAEPGYYLLYGVCRLIAPGLGSAVQIRAAVDGVDDVALSFEAV